MTCRPAILVLLGCTLLGGCGALPTDRPPTDNPYSVSYSADPNQPAWHRLLFGTRWTAEGPPQRSP